MPTTNSSTYTRLRAVRRFSRQYRTVIGAGVEGLTLLLRLPLLAHIVVTITTEVLLSLLAGERRKL